MIEDKSGKSWKQIFTELSDRINKNSGIIETEKIDYIIFGYDLKSDKKTKEKSSETYMKRVLINKDVRNEVKNQFLNNLNYLTKENVEFINWGSASDIPKGSVEIANIEIIDKSLRSILLNPYTDSQVIMEDLDLWKHVGLLTIIKLDNKEAEQSGCDKVIGINSLTRTKIATKKKRGVVIKKDGVLQYISDVRLFTLSELYDAILICDTLLIIHDNNFYKLFVLNEYFKAFFENNKNTISNYIQDPKILYDKISGDIKKEKKLISIVNNVLSKNPDPSKYEELYEKYKDKLDKIVFSNHKIDVNESDLNAVLGLLHLDYDEDPMFGSHRRVLPRYGR
ncbi:MAG: hypothetical protein ACP5IB_09955 [Thermoplasmata archaeon]